MFTLSASSCYLMIPDEITVVTSPYNIVQQNLKVVDIVHDVGPLFTDDSLLEYSNFKETIRSALMEAVRCGAISTKCHFFGYGELKFLQIERY